MFKGIEGRLYLTRILTVIGLLAAMVITYKLWSGNRYFPLVSLLPFSIPIPYDIVLPYLLATTAILSLIYPDKRSLPIIFTITGVLLSLFDLNRLQPWYYQYLQTFGIFLFKDPKQQLRLLKILFGCTYLWGGIHKINPVFWEQVVPWFNAIPERNFGETAGDIFKYLFMSAPVIEIITGAGMLFFRVGRLVVITGLLTHLIILWITGPAGHNYNEAIWPWNIVQLVLIPVLFHKGDESPLKFPAHVSRKAALVFLLLVGILPALNLAGWWPTYMSFNLYSGTSGYGHIYLGSEAVRFTPYKLKEDYFPGLDTTFRVGVAQWGMDEMNVPPFPERITHRKVQQQFLHYMDDSSQVVLSWFPRRRPWIESVSETY